MTDKKIDLAVLGSMCFDTISTKEGRVEEEPGGSGLYAAIAAAKFGRPGLLGVCGFDFADAVESGRLPAFERLGIDTDGIQFKDGATFRWTADYGTDGCRACTTDRQHGVMTVAPRVPESYKHAEYVLLANYIPKYQYEIWEQFPRCRLSMADTMDTYIESNREDLSDLIRHVDIIVMNADEARQYTGMSSLCNAGVKLMQESAGYHAIIKCGEFGAMMFGAAGDQGFKEFIVPAYNYGWVKDTTGAGDTMAGAFMSWMATNTINGRDFDEMKDALRAGMAAASFTVEDWGTRGIARTDREKIIRRYVEIGRLVR